MADKYIVYADGGARGNPGPAGAGAMILDSDGQVVKTLSKFLGKTTNNQAEYQALVMALQVLKKVLGTARARVTPIEVRLDSELIVKQLNGDYQVKDPEFWPWFMAVWNLRVSDFKQMKIVHIPRSENAQADALANQAMDQGS
jgi:ribonuclease HI